MKVGLVIFCILLIAFGALEWFLMEHFAWSTTRHLHNVGNSNERKDFRDGKQMFGVPAPDQWYPQEIRPAPDSRAEDEKVMKELEKTFTHPTIWEKEQR